MDEEPTSKVEAEPEDILVKDTMEDEEVKTEKKKSEGQELTAAAALTSLNAGGSDEDVKKEGEADDEEEDEEEEEEEEGATSDNKDFKIPLRLTKSGRRRATPFPLKVSLFRLVLAGVFRGRFLDACPNRFETLLPFFQLMKVLSKPEFAEIIGWTPSGKAFNIIQSKVFVAKILPDHFKNAKYSSFTRKLHRWGFMRHYRGPEAGAFFHKNFRRGRMDMVEKMTCYKPTPPKAASGGRGAANDSAPAMDTSMGKDLLLQQVAAAPNMMGGMGGLPFNAAMMQQQGLNQQILQMQGFMPQAQQQMLFQQQQQMQGMNPSAFMGSPQAQGSSEPGLDAAIEMEVTRRLKERINAAALSRQAMGMMQQQQQQQTGMSQGQMDSRFLYQGVTPGAQMNAPSMANAASGNFKPFEHPGLNFNMPIGGEFMPSNIQGAKTA
jgi:hypothetical protein